MKGIAIASQLCLMVASVVMIIGSFNDAFGYYAALRLNLVGSVILIASFCLFGAATSKSPLGITASALGTASGVSNMLLWSVGMEFSYWEPNWGSWSLVSPTGNILLTLVNVFLAASAVVAGCFFLTKRKPSKDPGVWMFTGILYVIAGISFGPFLPSYVSLIGFFLCIFSAVLGVVSFGIGERKGSQLLPRGGESL